MIFKNLFRRNQKNNSAPFVVIVGLGNPGAEYAESRHNAGFIALEYLRETFGFENFKEDKKYLAEVSFGMIARQKVILLKPTPFMNNSGKSVRALLDFYKLSPASLIVIHDEVDLPPGTLRTTSSSRAAGHNGVQNIIDTIGTQDFFRVRLGIGKPVLQDGVCILLHDYVLQKFSPEEKEKLKSLFSEVETIVKNRLEK